VCNTRIRTIVGTFTRVRIVRLMWAGDQSIQYNRMAKIRVKTPALLCNITVPRADRQDFRITV